SADPLAGTLVLPKEADRDGKPVDDKPVSLPSEAQPAPEPARAAPQPAAWWPALRRALPLVVLTAYAAGVGFFLARWLVGLGLLVRLYRSARPAPAEVLALFERIAGPRAGRAPGPVPQRTPP